MTTKSYRLEMPTELYEAVQRAANAKNTTMKEYLLALVESAAEPAPAVLGWVEANVGAGYCSQCGTPITKGFLGLTRAGVTVGPRCGNCSQ